MSLSNACPRCGGTPLFKGFLGLRENCTACGLDYRFADAGDGPAVFVILIAGAILMVLVLLVEVNYQPAYWVHGLIFLPLSLLLCLGMLRPLKAWLIHQQYRKLGAGKP
jgi:uncharacterized protein (DUF983 family)